MRKAQFTEHQIITVLKSVETGWTCREAGISEAKFSMSLYIGSITTSLRDGLEGTIKIVVEEINDLCRI